MKFAPLKVYLILTVGLLLSTGSYGRKRRKANEIILRNEGDQALRIRCQSILTDLRDQFLQPDDQFRFRFYDFDLRNRHFWCDASGLDNFDEHFDIFGGMAPKDGNLTWVFHDDGLYVNDSYRFIAWWSWPSFI